MSCLILERTMNRGRRSPLAVYWPEWKNLAQYSWAVWPQMGKIPTLWKSRRRKTTSPSCLPRRSTKRIFKCQRNCPSKLSRRTLSHFPKFFLCPFPKPISNSFLPSDSNICLWKTQAFIIIATKWSSLKIRIPQWRSWWDWLRKLLISLILCPVIIWMESSAE